MSRYPKVSLLMLNWNGIDFTRQAIKSLLKLSYPSFEIILVDNGSRNNEGEILKREFENNVTVVINKKNIGYAAGMNLAFSRAKGEFVMFLNNDMQFPKNWLNPLVDTLLRDKTIGACQPKIRDLRAKNKFEYAAAAGGFIDIFGYPFARGRIFSSIETDSGQYNDPIRIAWGGVLLARRKLLKKIGVFDPIYFNYAEDVDLCYRIYRAGYTVMYVPTSTVYHYGGGVLGKNMGRKMFFIHRNHIILLLKNWDTKRLLYVLPPRLLMDMASFFYYMSTGYATISLAMIKSYTSLVIMLPQIYKSRKKLMQLPVADEFYGMPIYHGSIVSDYFIRHKRNYSEIFQKK